MSENDLSPISRAIRAGCASEDIWDPDLQMAESDWNQRKEKEFNDQQHKNRLWDYYAAAALTGVMANQGCWNDGDIQEVVTAADAMLAERERRMKELEGKP